MNIKTVPKFFFMVCPGYHIISTSFTNLILSRESKSIETNDNMKILIVAFMLLFSYLDTLTKLYKFHIHMNYSTVNYKDKKMSA